MKEGIPVCTVVIENGKYYDTGDKFEYLKTVIEFVLEHEEINGEFKTFKNHSKSNCNILGVLIECILMNDNDKKVEELLLQESILT